MKPTIFIRELISINFPSFKIYNKAYLLLGIMLMCQLGNSQPNLICSSTDDTDMHFQPSFAVQGLENDKLIYGKVKDNSSSNMSNGFIRKISNDCGSSTTLSMIFLQMNK